MTAAAIPIFEVVLHKANAWVAEVARAQETEDRHAAYRALRAVLHTLRDRLTVNEACQLAAQLPLLVRGIYFEGYRPAGKPLTQRTEDAFLEAVRAHHGPGLQDARAAVCAVLKVLADHVSPGEVADVKGMLPAALQGLWPQTGSAVLIQEAPAATAALPAPTPHVPAPGPDLGMVRGAIGAAVVDLVGEKLGTIHDVVLDADSGQVRYAVIAFGGFLGLGEHLFPVPWKRLHWREGDGCFQLLLHEAKRTVHDLHQAPKVPRQRWHPRMVDKGIEKAVHSFYGGPAL